MNDLFAKKLQKLKKYYLMVSVFLISILSASLVWNIYNEVQHAKDTALSHARNSYTKDMMFRQWVSDHGGVYVEPSEGTPPNKYLSHIKDRDIVSTTGKKLTLMNPAYILRELMENYEGMYGAKGHITSLTLMNPNNKPSEWEEQSLRMFEKGGEQETYDFMDKDGQEHIFFMKSMITKEACLKCHAFQGYKVGDVRGGVSVIIPMKEYHLIRDAKIKKILALFSVFYFILITGLLYTYKVLRNSMLEQEALYEDNRKKDEIMLAQSRNAAMGEMISMIAHQWRQPIATIAMWANNISVDIDMNDINEKNFSMYAKNINEQTKHLSQTIDDFRNFFRPDKSKEKVMVKDVMEDCLGVIGKSIQNNNIEIEKNYSSELFIEIHSRELMQVFLNIIKNAKEALEGKDIKEPKITINIYEDEYNVITEIKDNALGIKEDILSKIFNPYFTTKGVHSGTGIGLYMSKTIVDQHLGGSISAENITNGVCFKVSIPKV